MNLTTVLLFCFWQCWGWVQDFTLARQALHHVSHAPGFFFALVSFQIESCTFAWGRPWTYWLRWGLDNFLPGLASNQNPPDCYFSSSWNYRCVLPHPITLGFCFFFCGTGNETLHICSASALPLSYIPSPKFDYSRYFM
jgi:hypothetical protein